MTIARTKRGRQDASPMSIIVRSLAKAYAALKRVVPSGARGALAHRPPAHPARELNSVPLLTRLEHRQRSTRDQAARIERRLERLHSLITTGVGSCVAGSDGEALDPQTLIERARRLRDELHEKNADAARLARYIAREQSLASVQPSVRPTPTTARARSARPLDGARAQAKLTALREALVRSSFSGRAERLAAQRLAEQLAALDAERRRAAVLKLASMGRPASVRLLMIAAQDESDRVRVAALNALAGTKARAVTQLYAKALRDKNPALRLAALRGLAGLTAQPSIDELTAALDDDSSAVRRAAATILGWQRGASVTARSIEALVMSLGDEDVGVRVAAAESLGALGEDAGVMALIRAIADPSSVVRNAAWRSLAGIVGESVQKIGEGLPVAERVHALKCWWVDARVDLRNQWLRDRVASAHAHLTQDTALEPEPEAAHAEPFSAPGTSERPSPEASEEQAGAAEAYAGLPDDLAETVNEFALDEYDGDGEDAVLDEPAPRLVPAAGPTGAAREEAERASAQTPAPAGKERQDADAAGPAGAVAAVAEAEGPALPESAGADGQVEAPEDEEFESIFGGGAEAEPEDEEAGEYQDVLADEDK
jgi:HEAT repeat protein